MYNVFPIFERNPIERNFFPTTKRPREGFGEPLGSLNLGEIFFPTTKRPKEGFGEPWFPDLLKQSQSLSRFND